MSCNAGYDFETVNSAIENEKDSVGYNFLTGEVSEMFDSGIIDPAKVTKNALVNAVSAAGTLLTTNFAIIEEQQ